MHNSCHLTRPASDKFTGAWSGVRWPFCLFVVNFADRSRDFQLGRAKRKKRAKAQRRKPATARKARKASKSARG
jgi:hypothetical protein